MNISLASLLTSVFQSPQLRKYIPYFVFLNSVPLIALLLFPDKTNYSILFTFIPFCIFAVLNFRSILFLLPVTFFMDIHPLGFAISEWMTLLLIISFVFTHRNITWMDISIPLMFQLFLYLLILVLSVFKSVNPLLSSLFISHYLLLIALIMILPASIKKYRTLIIMLSVYIVFVTANSIHVIIEAMYTGKRVFGFAGIMFVDYVGISIIISTTLALLHKRFFIRMLNLSLAAVFIIALLLTQTRTIWMATIITFVFVIIFIFVNHSYFEIDPKKFRRNIILVTLFFSLGITASLVFNTNTFSRLSESNTGSGADVSESGLVKNSLISRMLIWHTGFNAFTANPLLGIGAYAFPFSSQYYYTIPRLLYRLYVEEKSPHQTFIAVAIETGIVGLIAFIILWISIFLFVYRKVLSCHTSEQKRVTVAIGSGVIYCLVSMWTTDAWLWGHGIILFGLSMGSFMVYEKIKMVK